MIDKFQAGIIVTLYEGAVERIEYTPEFWELSPAERNDIINAVMEYEEGEALYGRAQGDNDH